MFHPVRVAIVGTRRPTLDGLETARRLARLTARAGGVVVSGMARGIDRALCQLQRRPGEIGRTAAQPPVAQEVLDDASEIAALAPPSV